MRYRIRKNGLGEHWGEAYMDGKGQWYWAPVTSKYLSLIQVRLLIDEHTSRMSETTVWDSEEVGDEI